MSHFNLAVFRYPGQSLHELIDREQDNYRFDHFKPSKNLLRKKNCEYCSICKVGNMNTHMDARKYRNALDEWDVAVNHKHIVGVEPLFNAEYYIDRFGTRVNYARRMATFSTSAVLLPWGEWHDEWTDYLPFTWENEEYWFAHYKERFLDTADPNWIITVLDCHS